MEPEVDGGSGWPDSSTATSSGMDTVTGSKAVAKAADSNSPPSKARRQTNTWFAFTPCALATRATLAPGANVNSTIRRFSATVQLRRIRRSASPASSMTTSSNSNPLECQRGRPHAYTSAVDWGVLHRLHKDVLDLGLGYSPKQ